jgi:hypothetical protein
MKPMAKLNRKKIKVLSERLQVSEELLIHCVDCSLVQWEERGEHIDLTGGTALQMRRLQRLVESLDLDAAIASLLLDQMEKIARLEREINVLRQKTSSPSTFQSND